MVALPFDSITNIHLDRVARLPTPEGAIFYTLIKRENGFEAFYRQRYNKQVLGRCFIDPNTWTITDDLGPVCAGEDPRSLRHRDVEYLIDNSLGASSLIVPKDEYKSCRLPSRGKNLSLVSHGDTLVCLEWLRPLSVLATEESPYPETWKRIKRTSSGTKWVSGEPDYTLRGGTPGYETPVKGVYIGFGHRTTDTNGVVHTPFAWRLDVDSLNVAISQSLIDPGLALLRNSSPAYTESIKVLTQWSMGLCSTKPGPDDELSFQFVEDTGGTTLANKVFGFDRDFKDHVTLQEEIGRGSFGRTHIAEAKSRSDGKVAVKVIPKSSMITDASILDVIREVEILKLLSGHSGIVEFIAAYEDSVNVYIVMELCKGGELMDHILSRSQPYPESKAVDLVWQVLTAVAYMHDKNIIHRDIKPENFLFADTKDNVLKAIDFGLSYKCYDDETVKDVVGSPFFVAPEVLKQAYNLKADEWSIGVLTYILLIGTRPFFGRTDSEIFKAVLRADPDIDNTDLSLPAKDFLKRLLQRNVATRSTAREALNHPWIKDRPDPPSGPVNQSDDRMTG